MSIKHINQDLCNGCRSCIDACPMDVIKLDPIANHAGESAPCQFFCPAGVNIRTYVYYLQNGMIEKAIEVLRESLPFPAVTGRICPHPCESNCNLKQINQAVNINALERFVADYAIEEKAQTIPKIYSSRIAIIGSGPAGLSCAYFLNKMGYPVTVFESQPALGGMLRYGIPEFRLPKKVLDLQIQYIRDMGVEFKTSTAVGKDISFDRLHNDFDAVFIATGNQLSKKIPLEHIDQNCVVSGLDFLRDINQMKKIVVPESVVVIGGGNVAVDAAMAALRLGAKDVHICCLEDRNEMPANREELKQAIDEGITINTSSGPKRLIKKNGEVYGIELVRCERLTDDDGNMAPLYNENECKVIEGNLIIFAIGQLPDLSFISNSLNIGEHNNIIVNPITQETNLTNVFAGGDITTPGGMNAVEAVAAGKRAAISIERYLKHKDIREGRPVTPKKVVRSPKKAVAKMDRLSTPVIPADQRFGNFKEIKKEISADSIDREAERCMTCGSRAIIAYPDDCQLCLFCERDCPQKAIYVSPERKVLPIMAWG